jgi:hypothetical protein
MTTHGIIYLIQPAELVNTNKFKFGCSKSATLDRCTKGYKKGSRYLHISECTHPIKLENMIKKEFNEKYTLICGNEFFEGDEDDIVSTFVELVMKHKKLYPKIKNKIKNDKKEINEIDIEDNEIPYDDTLDDNVQIIALDKKIKLHSEKTYLTINERFLLCDKNMLHHARRKICDTCSKSFYEGYKLNNLIDVCNYNDVPNVENTFVVCDKCFNKNYDLNRYDNKKKCVFVNKRPKCITNIDVLNDVIKLNYTKTSKLRDIMTKQNITIRQLTKELKIKNLDESDDTRF